MIFSTRRMQADDWAEVCRIYQQGILSGAATFQTELPTQAEWNQRHLEVCRLVAVDENGQILGWVALGRFSSRFVYRGVAEVSIYVANEVKGRGVGTMLLMDLIDESERTGFWTLQAGIIEGNMASYALHMKCGFRQVGVREKLGRNAEGIWKDVYLVERRSQIQGI